MGALRAPDVPTKEACDLRFSVGCAASHLYISRNGGSCGGGLKARCGGGGRMRERAARSGAVEYMEGTRLYYGSSIALQSCGHGGFLCLDSSRKANAKATCCRQPNVMMKVSQRALISPRLSHTEPSASLGASYLKA